MRAQTAGPATGCKAPKGTHAAPPLKTAVGASWRSNSKQHCHLVNKTMPQLYSHWAYFSHHRCIYSGPSWFYCTDCPPIIKDSIMTIFAKILTGAASVAMVAGAAPAAAQCAPNYGGYNNSGGI